MKSVLVIGMGRMGRHLAKTMLQLGNEVLAIDRSPEIVEALPDVIKDANIGDCTNENVIQALGVETFDVCFVTISDDFQASMVVTSLLKTYGAKMIVAKAKRDIQADLLKKIGADEVIYPERESAEKLAIRYNSNNIFDYVKLNDQYAIYEIPVPSDWINKSISGLAVRQKHHVNIIAVKKGMKLEAMPGPEYVFTDGDHIVLMGMSHDVFELTNR